MPDANSCMRHRVNPVPARRVLRLVNDTGYPDGPARPEGRLLALRCLGIPQIATRTPMSRRRALCYRLAACWARIRPGTTAELASLVLRMSDEIDTRERMLDAALGVGGRGPDRTDFDLQEQEDGPAHEQSDRHARADARRRAAAPPMTGSPGRVPPHP